VAREPNPVDVWRGLALVTIFITHIPGLWWEFATHRNYSFSDAAELFVFLAGWSMRRIADGRGQPAPLGQLMLRLGVRATQLYAAQIFLTMLAIAFVAAAALLFQEPLVLEFNNTAAVFTDPVQAHVGLMLLSHQLGYFDILPLYVVLMVFAPFMVAIDRLSTALLVAISASMYFLALATGTNLPTWPVQGVWYFNPLAWQFIFVLGFVLAREARPGRRIGDAVPHLRWAAWVLVIAAAVANRTGTFPDPLLVPEPTLLFVVDKTYLTPLRLIQFLALVVAAAPLYPIIARVLPAVARYGAALGRNSLPVFCVGSLASLAGQITRFILGSGLWQDTLILVAGLVALRFTAWVVEWRSRSRDAASEA
jgi:hypothetical protein